MTLTRRTPLRRTGPPARRTRLSPVGARKRRTLSAEQEFRRVVSARVWCEGNEVTCSALPHRGAHSHHIFPSDRRRGVHLAERGLWLCDRSHRFVHDHPEWSYANGFLGRAS